MWYNWLYHLSVLEFFPCLFLADKEQRLFCNVLLKVTFTDANTFCISCFSREWLFFYSHCLLNRFSVQESTVFDRSSVASLHFFIFYLAFAYPSLPVFAYWTQLTVHLSDCCVLRHYCWQSKLICAFSVCVWLISFTLVERIKAILGLRGTLQHPGSPNFFFTCFICWSKSNICNFSECQNQSL